ncbi:MAG: hypothetical protein M0Z27_02505 [Thermaerobacter sp.]|nr:hypothetical protein [Thermaerobacter sp.]MDA8144921.1 hypothetical protein [Thermaerobacter sp.]
MHHNWSFQPMGHGFTVLHLPLSLTLLGFAGIAVLLWGPFVLLWLLGGRRRSRRPS